MRTRTVTFQASTFNVVRNLVRKEIDTVTAELDRLKEAGKRTGVMQTRLRYLQEVLEELER